ncbi:hypothetical protein F9288_14385 [Sphingomonas sp. CL5.1]|uniref:squalene/phytoene synthase family protein n=1 Tax=Sphingomonas sp. CL5.1 TaxID=2653203 RepID=UPI0015817CEB|nr:squalene/phytoene synthase family protein [Sphingomonas sp. CL5.1]QKS00678.1 hypothetical protein F9288_14385 [Sphingomonas sp. CL5.1]
MVNWAEIFGVNPSADRPDRALALGYARTGQEALHALFALDVTLARITLGTRDPLVAQMRLTWWHDALQVPEPPAHPILRALRDVDGARAAAMTDGWQQLLDTPDDAALMAFASGRGELFALAAAAIGATDAVEAAGRGWALADLSEITADRELARRARVAATPLLEQAARQRWSGGGRALGGLIHLARLDLAVGVAEAGARRVARLAWHRLSGR